MAAATFDDAAGVLYVGGTAADGRVAQAALLQRPYDVRWVATLGAALERLATAPVRAILLDTQVPDSPGIQALERLVQAAPTVPVLVIVAAETDAVELLAAGARDCLLASRLDGYWLPRAIRYAVECAQSEGAVLAERARAELTLDSIGDGLITLDASLRITSLNRMAEVMTGWVRADAIGERLDAVVQIVNATTREAVTLSGDAALSWRPVLEITPDNVLVRRNGTELAVEYKAQQFRDVTGRMTGATVVFRDVTTRRAMSLQMAHLASHDPLTDLPNRLLLSDRLGRSLEMVRRYKRWLAVLFIDIDRFKYINDSLGHLVGDELIRSIAREITKCVRSSDTVSRHGGDEFVVVLSELEHAEDAAAGAAQIVATLARPQNVSGHEIHITVSVGISVYPTDGHDAETLLRAADMALYHAKAQGRDQYQFFEPILNRRAAARQSTETGLHGALGKREFELAYQPKVHLGTGAIVGAEALLRWRRSDRLELVEASQFVPVAEECGLITPIGHWAVHEACRQAQAWRGAGLKPITMGVNISGGQFRRPDFLGSILGILSDTGLDPHALEIEFTESVLMAHDETTSTILRELKRLGVGLAIDDFGTGWSSLSYLRNFPIDALKIDKSFVQEITAGLHTSSLVSAVIRLGKSLGLRVVAEGVEISAQLAFLQAELCDEGQGYYFGRPMPAAQFAALLDVGAPVSQIEQPGSPRWPTMSPKSQPN